MNPNDSSAYHTDIPEVVKSGSFTQPPENVISERATESSKLNTIARSASPMSSRAKRDSRLSIEKERGERITVTGAFPPDHCESGALVETIRDPDHPERMVFVRWKNGSATFFRYIEHEGRIFVPPDPTLSSFPELSLPSGLQPCGGAGQILVEITRTISKFVKLRTRQLWIVVAFVLASWFPDCFESAPYLWIVGPLGSGKTTLLKLLSRLCRRGLIAGDLRSGSLYKLVDAWDPTLIIDELELGSPAANVELFRLLRTGSTPGTPTFRNGRRFSTYCCKVISSRQPLGDAALSSRGLIISMLPTMGNTAPLDVPVLRKLEEEFQPKLFNFRLQNYATVRDFSTPPKAFDGLSARMRQIARALSNPMLGGEEWTSGLLNILRNYDREAQIERSLEPEWVVGEFLLASCHVGLVGAECISVGGIAEGINKSLACRSEGLRFSAKKLG